MTGVVDGAVVVVVGGSAVVVVVGGGAVVVVVVGGTVVVVVGGTVVVVVGGRVVVVVGGFVVVVVVGCGCRGRVVVVTGGRVVVVVVGTTGSGIGTNGRTMVVGEGAVVPEMVPPPVTTGAMTGLVATDGDVRTVGVVAALLCEPERCSEELVGATGVLGVEVDGGGTRTGSGAIVVVVTETWFDPACEPTGDSPKFSGVPRCPTTRNATPAVMATTTSAKISGPRLLRYFPIPGLYPYADDLSVRPISSTESCMWVCATPERQWRHISFEEMRSAVPRHQVTVVRTQELRDLHPRTGPAEFRIQIHQDR